jgi:mono/diheme cytochrome c family protein
MNRQVGYIANGFLLLLVMLAGLSVIDKLVSGAQSRQAAADVNVSSSSSVSESPARNTQRGEKLFNDNCRACHALRGDDVNLQEAALRVENLQLLYDWIRDSDKVLKSGNKYYNDLYKKWGRVNMSPSPHLTDEEIGEILAYIRHARNW